MINKNAITESKYVKYLGVLIDAQLSFKYHIEELSKKISRSIGVLYKIRPFVSQKIIKNLYYAIVYPFLLYGITIWGNSSVAHLSHIHLLQKKFVRMATYSDQYPCVPGRLAQSPPLFHKLDVLTIYDIFKLQIGILVFEQTAGIGPNIIDLTWANAYHNHNTRYSNSNFFVNFSRTTRYGLKSLQMKEEGFGLPSLNL